MFGTSGAGITMSFVPLIFNTGSTRVSFSQFIISWMAHLEKCGSESSKIAFKCSFFSAPNIKFARALGGSNISAGSFRSEEHTSELQSRPHLVCRLLLEKKKNYHIEFVV